MAEILQPGQLDRAVDALGSGQLVAFPTETVYGLGADATQPEAVNKIFAAKGRPTGHPLIVHVANSGGLEHYGSNVSAQAHTLADAFWPGPLTIIVERQLGPAGHRSGRALVADETVGGRSTVGLRVPNNPVALELLRRFGSGVAAPSANVFGGVSPTTAQHVVDDLASSVAYVIDGGSSSIGVESTIVDVSDGQPKLLRPGGISTMELEAALGTSVIDGRAGPSRAPGMMASHYSPKAIVTLVQATELQSRLRSLASEPSEVASQAGGRSTVGVLAPRVGELLAEAGLAGRFSGVDQSWDMPTDARVYATRLYAALRQADTAGIDRLFVVPPESGELLDAVVDRLEKAAAVKSPSCR